MFACVVISEHDFLRWIKIDQLDVTCFIISLFNNQHVSNVSTSILRSLRLICWVISWVLLLWFDVCWCYGVVRLGWSGILMQAEALPEQYNTWNKSTISLKLLKMDVLTFETCWAANSEIIKQVISSWSIFIQYIHIYVCVCVCVCVCYLLKGDWYINLNGAIPLCTYNQFYYIVPSLDNIK